MPIVEEVRTITPDGRVVVPWVIQRALGLDHGGPVRFRIENGVVTLLSVAARGTGAAAEEPPPTDVRARLARELKALLAVAERVRASQAADE